MLPFGMLNLEFRVGGGRKYTITENTSFYHGTKRKDAVVTARITGFLTLSRIRFPQLCLMKMIPNLSSAFPKSLQMNLPLFSEQCKPHLEFIRHIPCWLTYRGTLIYSSLWLLLIFSFKLFFFFKFGHSPIVGHFRLLLICKYYKYKK